MINYKSAAEPAEEAHRAVVAEVSSLPDEEARKHVVALLKEARKLQRTSATSVAITAMCSQPTECETPGSASAGTATGEEPAREVRPSEDARGPRRARPKP